MPSICLAFADRLPSPLFRKPSGPEGVFRRELPCPDAAMHLQEAPHLRTVPTLPLSGRPVDLTVIRPERRELVIHRKEM